MGILTGYVWKGFELVTLWVNIWPYLVNGEVNLLKLTLLVWSYPWQTQKKSYAILLHYRCFMPVSFLFQIFFFLNKYLWPGMDCNVCFEVVALDCRMSELEPHRLFECPSQISWFSLANRWLLVLHRLGRRVHTSKYFQSVTKFGLLEKKETICTCLVCLNVFQDFT